MQIEVKNIESIIATNNNTLLLNVCGINNNIISSFSAEELVKKCNSLSELIKEIMNTDEYKNIIGSINNQQEDWMNPESDKYYKGFRYYVHKFENNSEKWYDENGLCRKVIGYHKNRIKYLECYYDEKFQYHNEDGYAYQEWDRYGFIKYQSYYLNGKELTEEEWKEKTGNIESSQPVYLNPESDKYYKGFRYKKFEPTGTERWYDENGTIRKVIFYHTNGIKNFEWYYNEKSEWHNEDGYAYQEWDENGVIILTQYWLNGEKIDKNEWEIRTKRKK